MQKITIEKGSGKVNVFVGKVNQDGNYQLLKLTEAEAAVLAEKLQAVLYH